jgi:hypothetical protein
MGIGNFIRGSGSLGSMMVNAVAEGIHCEAISYWLVVLVLSIGELTLIKGVDDTFTYIQRCRYL